MEKPTFSFLPIFLAVTAAVILVAGGAAGFWFYQEKLSSGQSPGKETSSILSPVAAL